jgi:hypothetical protein
VNNRRVVGGYYWRQHIAAGLQAEQNARRHIDALTRLNVPTSVIPHLLAIALSLGEIQAAFNQLNSTEEAQ